MFVVSAHRNESPSSSPSSGARHGQHVAAKLGDDPLVHGAQDWLHGGGSLVALVAGAALLHVAFVLGLSGASIALRETAEPPPEAEPIQVVIMADDAPVEIIEPPSEPPEEAAAPIVKTQKPDPIETEVRPPDPAAEPEPSEPPPPLVVGLNLESTVEGAGGPGFATGNTQRGATEDHAVDPASVPDVDTPPTGVSKNRRVVRPGSSVSFRKPRRKKKMVPQYPALLRAQGIEADVVVQVTIDAHGDVLGVRVVGPSEHDEFNHAAKKAALSEQFLPAVRGGVAVVFTLRFAYRFRLTD